MCYDNFLFGALNLGCGALFILLGIPLYAKKIPQNKIYGFLFPQSFRSREDWYEINRYGARQLIKWSLLLLVLGILYFVFPIQHFEKKSINAFLATAPIVICPTVAILKTLYYARQIG